jgi:NAD(P)-dependent dehydrogenase (short-subunit alcohol dehydrogenase family)
MTSTRLRSRAALDTGASGGVGSGVALRLLREGRTAAAVIQPLIAPVWAETTLGHASVV